MHAHSFVHMHGFTSLSADGLSQVIETHIHNLPSLSHSLFHFRYISILFSVSLSLSVSLCLSLSLSLSLSLFRYPHPLLSLLLRTQPLSLSLFVYISFCQSLSSLAIYFSPSFFSYVTAHTSNMNTTPPLSLVNSLALSRQPPSPSPPSPSTCYINKIT